MQQANRGLGRSLACIQHPATLLSIALLLLNDHLLKALAPSWITGKLSDFAGLFFFPFIVAALLSLLLEKARLSVRQIGALAFTLVAAGFLLLKTAVSFNALAGELVSAVLGRPAAFALDLTDLIALAALIPAWGLWSTRGQAPNRRFAYAALCIGALAAVATSPAPMPASVDFLVYDSGVIYASVENYTAYRSLDYGQTWIPCNDNECPAVPGINMPRRLPITVCDPDSPQYCFRITGKATIEQSTDGGKNWSVGWQYPPARMPYFGRNGESPKLDQITPRDILLVSGPQHFVLVAMGQAGVLRRGLPDGRWERVHVSYTSPVSYTAPDYASAVLDTAVELAIWMAISAALVILAGLQLWRIVGPRTVSVCRLARWVLFTVLGSAVFIVVAAWLVALILVWVFWSNPLGLPDWMETTYFVFGGATVIIYSAFFLSIQGSIESLLTQLVEDVRLQRSLLLMLFSMAVANSVAALAVWPIWAVGIVWDYRVALALAITSSMLIFGAGSWLVHRRIAQFEAKEHNKTAME